MISYSYSETFVTTPEGHAIAAYIAHKWRKAGRSVRVDETTQGICVTATALGSFDDIDPMEFQKKIENDI